MKGIGAVVDYFRGVRTELSQVVWPKRNDVIRMTIIVLAISAAVGIYLGGIDYLLTKGLTLLITLS